jgi:hypothetical protein
MMESIRQDTGGPLFKDSSPFAKYIPARDAGNHAPCSAAPAQLIHQLATVHATAPEH